jgi:hypothetical protein
MPQDLRVVQSLLHSILYFCCLQMHRSQSDVLFLQPNQSSYLPVDQANAYDHSLASTIRGKAIRRSFEEYQILMVGG